MIYRIGIYVLLNFNKLHNLPVFGLVKRIMYDESNNICFECQILNSVGFNEMLFSYEVCDTGVRKTVLFSNLYTHTLPVFCVMPCVKRSLALSLHCNSNIFQTFVLNIMYKISDTKYLESAFPIVS